MSVYITPNRKSKKALLCTFSLHLNEKLPFLQISTLNRLDISPLAMWALSNTVMYGLVFQ